VAVPTKQIRAIQKLAPHQPVAAVSGSSMVLVPIYHALMGEETDFQPEKAKGHLGLERAYVQQHLQADADSLAAFSMDGDSMEPTVGAREMAIMALSKPDAMVTDGIHILRLDGVLLCKRIARMPGDRLMVTSDNLGKGHSFDVDLHTSSKDFVIVGRVLLVMRRL
jgi:phage repressor protein C with HTH and peptisase S24 domain